MTLFHFLPFPVITNVAKYFIKSEVYTFSRRHRKHYWVMFWNIYIVHSLKDKEHIRVEFYHQSRRGSPQVYDPCSRIVTELVMHESIPTAITHGQVACSFLLLQWLLTPRDRIEVKRKQPVECTEVWKAALVLTENF